MGDNNFCRCRRCGHLGTGAAFTVATGGGDFEGQCPACGAGDDEIEDVDATGPIVDGTACVLPLTMLMQEWYANHAPRETKGCEYAQAVMARAAWDVAVQEAAKIVELRGKEIGGAIQPDKTARMIRELSSNVRLEGQL